MELWYIGPSRDEDSAAVWDYQIEMESLLEMLMDVESYDDYFV